MTYNDMLIQIKRKVENIEEEYSKKIENLKNCSIMNSCSSGDLDKDIENNNAERNQLFELVGYYDHIDRILSSYKDELKKFNDEREYVAELISALKMLNATLSFDVDKTLDSVPNFGSVSLTCKDINDWVLKANQAINSKQTKMPRLKFRYSVEEIQNEELKQAYTTAQEVFTRAEKALEDRVREGGGNVSKPVSLTVKSTFKVAEYIKLLLDRCIVLEKNSNKYVKKYLEDTKKYTEELATAINKFKIPPSDTTVDNPSEFLQKLSEISNHTENWNEFYDALDTFDRSYGMKISENNNENYSDMVEAIEDKYCHLKKIVWCCRGETKTYLENENKKTEGEDKKLLQYKKKGYELINNNKKKKGIFHKIQKLLSRKNH